MNIIPRWIRKAVAPPPGAKRRLRDPRISFVSLCKRGASGIRTALKAAAADGQESFEFQSLSKMSDDGLLYTIVYAPNLVDADGEFCTPEDVRKACHGYFAHGGQVDIHHNLDPLDTSVNGAINICEHGIIQKGDERPWPRQLYDGRPFDPTDSWGTIYKILDPELRRGYESGEWDGVSMYGLAYAEPVGKSATPNPHQENDMDPKELEAAVAKGLEGAAQQIAEQVGSAVTKALKPEEPAEPKATTKKSDEIAFEGDRSNPEHVRAHLAKVRAASVDMNDPKAVEAYLAELEKESGEGEPAQPAEGAESEELAKAKAELAKAQRKLEKVTKASNQSAADGENEGADDPLVQLGKDGSARFKLGSDLHSRWAKASGRSK